MDNWQASYLHEIERGFAARASGNEGRARVCARRAASYLIEQYLSRQGIPASASSAYTRLRLLSSQTGLSPAVVQIVTHLMQRVDESFTLPAHIDLLAEVQQLARELSLV